MTQLDNASRHTPFIKVLKLHKQFQVKEKQQHSGKCHHYDVRVAHFPDRTKFPNYLNLVDINPTNRNQKAGSHINKWREQFFPDNFSPNLHFLPDFSRTVFRHFTTCAGFPIFHSKWQLCIFSDSSQLFAFSVTLPDGLPIPLNYKDFPIVRKTVTTRAVAAACGGLTQMTTQRQSGCELG